MRTSLRERLLPGAAERDVQGDRHDTVAMARVAFWLYAVGGLLGLLVGTVVPHVEGLNEGAMVWLGLASLAMAAGVFALFGRIPLWALQVSALIGTVLTTASIYFTGPAPSAGAMLYLWTALFSSYFFSRRWAMAQISWIAAGYALILLLRPPPGSPAANWVVTVSALFVAGLLVSILKERAERLIARLEDAADTDPLTGLLNRRGFHEEFEAAFAARGDAPLGLIVADLDQFKQVNDRFGHAAGDATLAAVARMLDDCKRDGDAVARIGGEEFALVLPGCDEAATDLIAERLRAEIQMGFEAEPVPLTASFGVASSPAHGQAPQDLLQAADRALYAAKDRGRNRTALAGNEMQAADRRDVEAVLARPDGIQAVYQPFVALATGHVAGYEALARFPHVPNLPPNAWFAHAHDCGLGAQLEAKAIDAALAQTDRPLGTLLSLNLSPAAICAPEVIASLPEGLEGVVIEITEQELVRDEAALMASLDVLRSRGALIAVDDAGAGYAGLQRLMRLQPDMIKLDRSLIQGVHADPDKAALIESFVRFARRTGATVCAEGIETLEDMTVLADLDVTYGQGYALARPEVGWPLVASDAADACRASFAAAMEFSSHGAADHGDRRLELVSSALSQVTTLNELDPAMQLVAAELGAAEVHFSAWNREGGYVQTAGMHAWSPDGDRFELANYPSTRAVLEEQVAMQVLVSDPASDPAEVKLLLDTNHRACLMLPVVSHGETLGLIEAWRQDERPWGRADINRGRAICFHLGAILESFSRTRVSAPPSDG